MRFRTCLIIVAFLTVNIKAQDSDKLKNIDFNRERTSKLAEFSDLSWHSEDSLWYVGKEYQFNNTRSLGTPFFFDEMKLTGSLVFNEKKYLDLNLFYDLVRDELVLHYLSANRGSVFIILNKAWIGEFSLNINNNDYRFVPNTYFKSLKNNLPEGYLEVCYDNNLKLLFKYAKELHFEATSNDRYSYNYEQNIYLIKENFTYEISKKSKLLSLFPENKKQIRLYLRKSQIRYKNASRSELISLIEYCEKLS